MKALSIRAPWWWFILHQGKDIENRDWPTRLRGRVLVHASKWYVHKEVVDDLWFAERVCKAVLPAQHAYDYLKPYGGCIVGSVEIVDCVESSDSPWFSGRYGFVLRNPIAFDKPYPLKGALGFFEAPAQPHHKEREEQGMNEQSQQKSRQWISVDERLPDKFEHVLIYLKPVPEGPEWYPRTNYTLGWQKRGIWFGTFIEPDTGRVEKSEIPEEMVSHWMPMPEPPDAQGSVTEQPQQKSRQDGEV